MKIRMKKIIFLVFFLHLFINIGHAFDLDETVDDEIRKNYNDSKLIQDTGIESKVLNKKFTSGGEFEELPALPAIISKPTASAKTPDVASKSYSAPPVKQLNNHIGNIKIPKGTVLYVSSSNNISDYQKKGTNIKFVLKKEHIGKNYKLPAWTTFNGEIVESHQPQITCNGGLVSIRIYSLTCQGQTIPVNAYIVRANDKKIFLNDIKGQRTYLKTMWKKGNWGRSILNRMMTLTVRLGSEGSTVLLSPFPAVYGVLCYSLNTLTSPITAFFSKGGHVSIPAGSQFKIKLRENAYMD